jgi:hypothetical protein
MHGKKRNPHDICEGMIVAFLTNPAITYKVTRVWSTGKVELVTEKYNITFSAKASELFEARFISEDK